MKKKLIIAAVGAALAAGAMVANAAPTVYGHVHMSIDKFDNGGADSALNAPDGINVSSNSSRFGVKGTEDLGGGLAAAYQIELGVSADEEASANTTSGALSGLSIRNSFVGLAGGFGTVLAGRHDTPYKLATGALDPFSETVGDYNAVVGNSNYTGASPLTLSRNGFDLRVNNAIAYVSPAMGGFTLIAAYTMDPLGLGQTNGADQQGVDAISVAGLFSQGPLFVSVAYEKHNLDDDTVGALLPGVNDLSRNGLKVGASYDFDVVKVAGVYEKLEQDRDNTSQTRDAAWLNVSGKFGNNMWAVSYGQADDSDAAGVDDGAKFMAVGLFHNFSKTTKAYAVYASVDNDEGGTYRLGDSGHGDVVSGVANEKTTSVSVGMSVDF